MKRIPRVLIGATRSGAGKTVVVCSLLAALKNRGLKVAVFKCGPDYIDPMFHKEAMGVETWNLDSFFCEEEELNLHLSRKSQGKDAVVIEGVMGYYDGISGITTRASSYEVAHLTKTSTILVVDCKGASFSILAEIQGFLSFQKESHIIGVILNQISPMLYPRIKQAIKEKLNLSVFGYLPRMEGVSFSSRYLGLKQPNEIAEIKEKIGQLGRQGEETLEIDEILKILPEELPEGKQREKKSGILRVGLAKDEGFCFHYQENIELLEELGVELIPFSPISDLELPEHLDGLILYGGYPELYADRLEKNETMRNSILDSLNRGMPCLAECGGFMYLTEGIETESGERFQMVGSLLGDTYYGNRLKRFGYARLGKGYLFGKEVEGIPFHEFHYYDSKYPGEAFMAQKPNSKIEYACMVSTERMLAGYPHFYYPSCKEIPEGFVKACLEYQKERRKV